MSLMCLTICVASPARNSPLLHAHESEAESMSTWDAERFNKLGKGVQDGQQPAFKHSQIVNVIALPETEHRPQEVALPQSPSWYYQHYYYISYFSVPNNSVPPDYDSYWPGLFTFPFYNY